jgi:DNA (cytosine-5)-methyltransferase 1
VYLSNLPDTDYQLKSISEVKHFPRVDLLAGCYPCQGFSQGGARMAGRTINLLFLEFARALKQIRPKAFIVENVSGMNRADFRHLLQQQLDVFQDCGYDVVWKLLNAADYGVPQERKRIFIVGTQKKSKQRYVFPSPTHGFGLSRGYVSIRAALDGMPKWPSGEFFEDPFHWYYMSRNRRRGWDEVSKTIVGHARHMPLHPISPELRCVGKDKWIWTSNKPRRRFSYNEAARLQGFPPGFVLPDTAAIRAKYQVIGNAVPPPLFEQIVRALPS